MKLSATWRSVFRETAKVYQAVCEGEMSATDAKAALDAIKTMVSAIRTRHGMSEIEDLRKLRDEVVAALAERRLDS